MKKNAAEQTNDTQRLKRAFVAIEKLQSRLSALEYARTEPIAIIGIGCRFPGGANNPDAYWQLLHNKVDAISEVPPDRWENNAYYDSDWKKQGKINTKRSGFLDTRVYDFDPEFFGISPKETLQIDPQQRLLLEVTWNALENANIVPDRLFNSSTGVFIGISTFDYAVRQLGMQDSSEIGGYVGTGSLLSPAAGRLSYVLGLTGPSTVVDTACSSSLLAVHLACSSLRNKESDIVIAGGVNLILSPELSSYFSTAGMLSSDGKCKTFDESADGYVRSEGCGVAILKRLSDATADNDTILAVVRGSAVNQDGPSGGLTVPSGPSQERVIKKALENAKLEPNQIDYIEAHGTGTPLGDSIEVGALGEVFGKDRLEEQPLIIGSTKTNIGHLEAAAGMAGLIKVVLALNNEEISPHLHFNKPNPRIPWDSFPVKVPVEPIPWVKGEKKRTAGISSFGFSGTNSHVILEEAPETQAGQQTASGTCLLTLSAKSETALRTLAERYREYLPGKTNLGDICFTANTCRSVFQYKIALSADSSSQMIDKLTSFINGEKGVNLLAGNEAILNAGALFVKGESVDWSEFYNHSQYRKVVLPGYPFQRERLCIEREERNYSNNKEKLHALLDRKIDLPESGKTVFESEYHTDLHPLLKEHLVYDNVMVSGATHVSLILGASMLLKPETETGNGCELSDIVFEKPVLVPDTGCRVQLIVEKESQSFSMISFTNTDGFTNHVTGKMTLREPAVTQKLLNSENKAIRERCSQNITGDEFYSIQLKRHIYLGPNYQWVESINRGKDEAFCDIKIPKDLSDINDYQLHPGLIDACFGLLAVSVEMEVPDTFVPFCIEKFSFYQCPGDFRLQAHVQLRPESDDNHLVGDIRLFEKASGQIIAEFIGFEGRKTTRDSLLSEHQSDFNNWFYEIAWQPKPLKSEQTQPVQDRSGHWLIFADQTGVGLVLAKGLQKRGEFCTTVHSGKRYEKVADGRYYVNPAEPLDFQRLFNENFGDNMLRGVVHLWSLDSDVADLHHAHLLGCASVLHLAQSLVEKSWEIFPRLWLITQGGQAVGALQPQQTSVWGLGRAMALEHPELGCVCLDLDPLSEDNAQTLFNELWCNDHDNETQIVWRQNIRHVARLERCVLPQSANPFSIRENSSYLISGGTGVLGLQVARWLVENGARNLLLLSRSGISSYSDQEVIDQMEQKGAKILIIKVDVADQLALNHALDNVPAIMPPLRGIIHAAGMLDDGMLMGQNWDRFERVMEAKVYGAWNLHQRTTDMEIDFFVMFSSAASLLGNQGQSNYAAANAFLDGLAHYRKSYGLTATSINWGPWEQRDGMAASASADDRLSKQGFKPIQSEKGLAVLDRILSTNTVQVGAIACDWSKYFSQLTSEQALFANWQRIQKEQPAKQIELLQKIEKARPEEKHTILLNFVTETAQQAIGIDTSNIMDTNKPLMDLGMDSLMAVEIRNSLGKGLDTSLPVSLLFNYPTVNEITMYLEQKIIKSNEEHSGTAQSDEGFSYLDSLNQNDLEELINSELKSH
ncbi:MAG: SDR family NAD(P)-dependent oxidoreductase [Planctomycetes bacterium]|nr:SDR family NAD(P)-dependent oxidoreductase [Planctomycetota bacterium]